MSTELLEKVTKPRPFDVPTRMIAGLDLGQTTDPSAIAIVERPVCSSNYRGNRPYHVRHLQRWKLGTPYPEIVDDTVKMLTDPAVKRVKLGIDQTGVGRPVVDLFRARGNVTGITITSGHAVTEVAGGYHVPKKELASIVQMLLQTDRLFIAKGLPVAEVLVEELKKFKVKITTAGNEIFEAWRENDHDDLVLALAIACWLGERIRFAEAADESTPQQFRA